MADPAVLRDLARRAREASGPDRALDADVWFALLPDEQKTMRYGAPHVAVHHGDQGQTFQPLVALVARGSNVPRFTSSLNDIQREVVPPGWEVEWPMLGPLPPYHCGMYPPMGEGLRPARSIGQTEALAALATALEARATLAEVTP